MGWYMHHDALIHNKRLAELVEHLVLTPIKGIRTITEAGTTDREEITYTTGGQNADVSHVEWLALW